MTQIILGWPIILQFGFLCVCAWSVTSIAWSVTYAIAAIRGVDFDD